MRTAPPSLFLSTTPAPARAYLGRLFAGARAKYPRVIVPCVGRFSGPIMALNAGYKPDQIETSDISLFSSLIGALASGKDPRELGVTLAVPGIPQLDALADSTNDPMTYAAAILTAQKIGTAPEKNAHQQMVHADLCERWATHLALIRKGLEALVAKIKGVHYTRADVFAVVEQAAADPGAILYVDPPGFAGGYAKMFKTPTVQYAPPPIDEFKPKDGFGRLTTLLEEAPALGLILRAREEIKEDRAATIWAMPAPGRVKYLMANRPAEAAGYAGGIALTVKKDRRVDPGYPVWGAPDDRLRADSLVRFAKVQREVGLYYRDLFAHTLGATDTEMFVLMFVDGKVFGTIGLHLRNVRLGKSYKGQAKDDGRIFVWESFGFSSRHRVFRHLNRLLMMCVTCEGMLRFLRGSVAMPLGEPCGVRTACITKGHESKGNRGILKLLHREPRPDGRHYLVYQVEWRKGDFADQVKAWVAKYGNQQPVSPAVAAAIGSDD